MHMSKKIKMCIAVFCVVAISACLLCTTAFAESYQVIRDPNYYDIYDGTQYKQIPLGTILSQSNSYDVYVKYLQLGLNYRDSEDPRVDTNVGTADGFFGTKTYNAVKTFQGWVEIAQDGIAGHDTLSLLEIHCEYLKTH